MPGVKIGIQTRSLRQPFRQALNTAARLGVAAIEIDARTEIRPGDLSQTALRELLKLLNDRSLRVSAVAFPTRRGFDVPDDLERRVLAAQDALRMAARLHADVVVIRTGHVLPEADSAAWGRLVEALTALGVFGERVGARVALQTVDSSPHDLLRVIQALREQSTGIDLHPGGLIAGGFSIAEAVEVLGPFIRHVHACDAVRDVRTRIASEIELGRGAADFPELLGRLAEFDYRGWVTIERRESANPIAEMENAVVFLQSL